MTDAVAAIDQNKAAALAAGAQGGTAGLQAYQQATQQVQATRDAALASTAQGAQLINAGAPALNDLNAIVRSGADRRLADIAQAQGTFGADQAAANARTGRYFGELSGALPLLQELGRQKGEYAANKLVQAAADKAASGSDLSDSALRTRLMGAAQIQQDQALEPLQARSKKLDAQLKPLSSREKHIRKALSTMPKASKLLDRKAVGKVRGRLEKELAGLAQKRAKLETKAQRELSVPLSERARSIGTEAGVEPDRLYGIVGPQQDAQVTGAKQRLAAASVPEPDKVIARSANVDPTMLNQIRQSSVYTKVKKELLGELDAGKSWDEVEPLLRELLVQGTIGSGKKRYPRTYRVIESEFKRLFPSLSSQTRLADARAAYGVQPAGG